MPRPTKRKRQNIIDLVQDDDLDLDQIDKTTKSELQLLTNDRKEINRIMNIYAKKRLSMRDVINQGFQDDDLVWFYQSFERMKELDGREKHEMEDNIYRKFKMLTTIKQYNLIDQQNNIFSNGKDPITEIAKSSHSSETKNILISRIISCSDQSGSSEEYQKTLNWVDWILRIPTCVKSNNIPIDSLLSRLWDRMNQEMSCMQDVMISIMQAVCMMRCDSGGMGSVLTLVGPPGCGKTTLCSILANVINMGFGHISCGSIKDQAVLMGHSSTYIGAKPGIFTQILVNNQQLDNVILLDEMDKLPDAQILPILLHVLDRTQNTRFHDAFCPEINIDLSRNLFCIAVNTLDNFDSALLDRMKIIYLSGYDREQKKEIIIRHTIPRLEKRTGIMLKTNDQVINHLIEKLDNNNQVLSGMRELERGLEGLFEKLLLIMKSNLTILKDIYGEKNQFDQVFNHKKNEVTLTNIKLIDKLISG